MHYKNGRESRIGDWVVGPSHNSEGQLVTGVVVEIFTDRGDCSAKICRWRDAYFTEDGNTVFVPVSDTRSLVDYADCAKLFHLEDAFLAANIVQGIRADTSPYAQPSAKMFNH